MAFIIDDILSLPVKGIIGIFKEIHNYADKELNDIDFWQQKLLELQLRYEMGEIEELEFKQQEKDIVQRISEIQERG